MNLAIKPFETVAAEALTGFIIALGQKGDAAKIIARANAALLVVGAGNQFLAGNPTGGIAALGSAVKLENVDPGVALALQTALSLVAQQGAVLASLASAIPGVGSISEGILQNVLAGAEAAANAEIAHYSPKTAA